MEYNSAVQQIKELIPSFLVKGSDNACMILATIIGSIILLTIFNFSMVMIVLNRASASLSPRLISKKSHQFVLGFCIGKIGYYCGVDTKKLLKVLKQHNSTAKINIQEDKFVVENYPILLISKDVETEEGLQRELLSCFYFHIEEQLEEHYLYGLKKILKWR